VDALCSDKVCFDDEKGDDDDDRDILWAEFADSKVQVRDSHAHDENRVEILRLLVVALSEPLFNRGVSSGEVLQFVFDSVVDSTFADESVSEKAVALFVSMFAVLVENKREELAQHCCNALAAMLDLPPQGSNPLLYVFRNLPQRHREEVFTSLAMRMDKEQCTSASTLCLIWRLLDLNAPEVFTSLTEDTLASLVFTLSKALFVFRRESRTRHSSVQLVSILLFSLSCDRKTGIAINRPLSSQHRSRLPQGFPVTTTEWTYADCLVCSLQKFVMDGDSKMFEPLQRLGLTALVNFSWYIKSLSATPSQFLVTMFERVTWKSFLLSKETNHLYAKFLLEVFTNILQYQSQGNSRLIYAMLRSRHVFFDLHDLQLPTGEEMDAPVVVVAEEMNQPGDQDLLPKRFVPTREWLEEWKSGLAMSAPILAMKELAPKLDQIVSSEESDFLKLIESTTLVGALPPPPPIVISKYARTDKIDSVIRRCFWIDLLKSDDYLDLWKVPPTRTPPGRPRESSV